MTQIFYQYDHIRIIFSSYQIKIQVRIEFKLFFSIRLTQNLIELIQTQSKHKFAHLQDLSVSELKFKTHEKTQEIRCSPTLQMIRCRWLSLTNKSMTLRCHWSKFVKSLEHFHHPLLFFILSSSLFIFVISGKKLI